jgi:hypothetical protein
MEFFTMQPGSESHWYLGHQTFQSSSVTESWEVSHAEGESYTIGTAYSIDILGCLRFNVDIGYKHSLEGYYAKGQLSTFSTSFSDSDSLHVQMGLINSAGEYSNNRKYKIIPYAYWGNNGALILDFATEPEKNEQGEDPTWWQIHYSDPDPAFLLPQRFENEKWGSPDPEELRHETKEVFFFPGYPEPGDSVVIGARVHNYSLVDILHPVAVSFYVGDPDFYGEVLRDKNTGDSIFYTRDSLGDLAEIDAQGSAIASMTWQVPDEGSISSCQRIWAVIDPLDSISPEVHDNGDWATNNKGWRLFYVDTDPICVDSDGDGWADPAYRCHICPQQSGFDNCPSIPNPDQSYNPCLSCCVGMTGNVDGDLGELIDIGDLTALIAYLYIPPNPDPVCAQEANIDGDGEGLVDIGDLTALIAYLYIPPNPAPAGCQ